MAVSLGGSLNASVPEINDSVKDICLFNKVSIVVHHVVCFDNACVSKANND